VIDMPYDNNMLRAINRIGTCKQGFRPLAQDTLLELSSSIQSLEWMRIIESILVVFGHIFHE
jgi:flavin-binding protein dodecin